ncbi:hypothetical protein SAVIM338S_06921 [Streptomyces avidinii]
MCACPTSIEPYVTPPRPTPVIHSLVPGRRPHAKRPRSPRLPGRSAPRASRPMPPGAAPTPVAAPRNGGDRPRTTRARPVAHPVLGPMTQGLPPGGTEITQARAETLWASAWTPAAMAARLAGVPVPWYVAGGLDHRSVQGRADPRARGPRDRRPGRPVPRNPGPLRGVRLRHRPPAHGRHRTADPGRAPRPGPPGAHLADGPPHRALTRVRTETARVRLGSGQVQARPTATAAVQRSDCLGGRSRRAP